MNQLINLVSVMLQQRTDVNLPDQVNLSNPIIIPTFVDFSQMFQSVGGPSATVLSSITFVGTLLTILIAIFWIYKVVLLGVEGIQSEGKPEKIQELIKKLQNIFTGVFMSFLFPAILSIIGILAGIGTIFEWPRMFRSCSAGEDGLYSYYYQAYLDQSGANAVEEADRICGYSQTLNTTDSNPI